jgi:acetylornithine deacetylase
MGRVFCQDGARRTQESHNPKNRQGDKNTMDEAGIEGVLRQVDGMRDEIIDLERTLVRYDSVNQPPWGNEGPCQAFLAEYMQQMGLEVDCFTPDEVPGIQEDPAWLHGRDYTDRPNVVGTRAGTGGGPSLHLAAHADVVPIDKPADWTVAPFSAEVIGGKIYGRGSLDDKDGIVGMLTALQAVERAGHRLKGDVILSSYVDEEFAGGNGLLAVVRRGYLGEAAINCDGRGFKLWLANTGGGPFRVLIQGRVESTHPTPAMRKVQSGCREALAELSQRWRKHWDHPLYPEGTPWITREEPIETHCWEDGLEEWNWRKSGLACGVGGYATTLPGQDRAQAKAEIVAAVEDAYASCQCPDVYPPHVEWTYRFMDACEVSPDEPIVGILGWAYQRATGKPAEAIGGVRSDLYMLALHGGVPCVSFGVDTVLSGPGGAHEPNECIDIDSELIPYVKTLALAMMECCGCQ